ncbi:MAG: hypothetical protein R3E39_14600 [Anaerolineae bacterium]
MDLPFHLKALPPEALDVLRYFGTLDSPVAHAVEIGDGVGLSDRTFGKVIRRLVTKGYLQMDGDQAYRLSDSGQEAVEELLAFDEKIPAEKPVKKELAIETIKRQMVLVVPRTLASGKPATVIVGFQAGESQPILDAAADVVIRLSLVNAEPARPQESSIELDNSTAYRTFSITPGAFSKARIKVQAFQLGPNPDDIAVAGGMYVDVDISSAASADQALGAYRTDVTFTKESD